MTTRLVLVLLLAAIIPVAHALSSLVPSNSTDVTSTSVSYSAVKTTVASFDTPTRNSSSSPTVLTRASNHPPFPSNHVAWPSSVTTPASVESASIYLLTPTADVYHYITITRTAPQAPSFSNISAATAARTIYIQTADNRTTQDSFKEPHGISTTETWVSTVSDIAEICYRVLNTMFTLYNIRMTMKLIGRRKYIAGLSEQSC